MYTREFLSALRAKAVRQHVLYSALDGLERGILYLSTRLVNKVSSIVLIRQLTVIVTKLAEALKSGYQRHLEGFGFDRLARIVLQALKLGYSGALGWIGDHSFAEYLTVLDMNQPNGYKLG
jgi:hypothetical protein